VTDSINKNLGSGNIPAIAGSEAIANLNREMQEGFERIDNRFTEFVTSVQIKVLLTTANSARPTLVSSIPAIRMRSP
jgi:hypothetical protein